MAMEQTPEDIARSRTQFTRDDWRVVDDGIWVGAFELANGLVIQKTLTGFQMGGLIMNCPKYSFGAGSSLNGLVAQEDGRLYVNMPPAQYYEELCKMGKIVAIAPQSLSEFLTQSR